MDWKPGQPWQTLASVSGAPAVLHPMKVDTTPCMMAHVSSSCMVSATHGAHALSSYHQMGKPTPGVHARAPSGVYAYGFFFSPYTTGGVSEGNHGRHKEVALE